MVTLSLDTVGDTVVSIAGGLSTVTLSGVTQAQWGLIRDPDGRALHGDDLVATSATAGLVTVGGTGSNGRIETSTDKDWFAVNVTAGSRYTFTLSGASGGGGTLLDPYLELLSSAGTRLAYDDDSGTGFDSQITYTATTTGTLYLSAASGQLLPGTGSYRLSASVAAVVADDYAATTATTGVLTVGGTGISGAIEVARDTDWFAVNVTAGTRYIFTLSGANGGGGTLSDPYLELLSSTGTRLTYDNDSGTGLDSQISYTATTTGTLYLSAASSSLIASGTGTYRLSASTAAPLADDYAATTATTGVVTVGGPGSRGTIEAEGDSDWFAVNVTSGMRYSFKLSGADGGGGTLGDPTLELLSSTGVRITSDDNSGTGFDSQITYTPTTTGTLYLSAASTNVFAPKTGTYLLSAAFVDDRPSTVATTGQLSLSAGEITGAIETSGDTDWFYIFVDAGKKYTFTLSGVDGGGGTLVDPYLELLSGAGTRLAFDDNSGVGQASQITFTATTSATLYLSAGSSSVVPSGTGTYKLSVAIPDDYAATTATTGVVTVGGTGATGTIETAGDADWFAVDLIAGKRYNFELSSPTVGGLLFSQLELLSSTGTRIAVDTDSGAGFNSLIGYTATTTGRVYLSATASSLFSSRTGNYVLTATTDDYADSSATTGVLTLDAAATGTIELAGDKDWFGFDVTAGSQYRISLSGRDGGGGTVADPNLEVRSATGSLLALDYDGGVGADSLLTYTATTTGRVYLSVSASQYANPSTGTYRLSATKIEVVDDFAGSADTKGTVAVNGATTGNLEVLGDNDWFAVDLVAGTRYVINLSGRDGGGGTLFDPLLQVRKGDGSLIDEDDDGGVGGDSELSFVADTSGKYFISASSFDGAYTGTYRVSVKSAPTDDYAGTVNTTGVVAIGSNVTGRLELGGDQDWFAVDLVAGKTYSFSLAGRGGGGGTLNDPQLRLLSGQGVVLASNDDVDDYLTSEIVFTATTSGRYYLSAEGAESTETGTYTLSAILKETVAADPAGVKGGTPTDPLFASQWHLGGTYGLNVLSVWADYTGAGVRVGVLDQGIDALHRDLDDNLLRNLSTVAATGAAGGTPQTADDNHGTAVSGVIAAERNGFGGVGVAYNADLISYYDPLSSGVSTFAATVQATYIRAIANADVLNNSWGFGNFFKSTPNRSFLDDFDSSPFNVTGAALLRLASEGRGGKGTVVVQSAGNTAEYGDDTNLHNFQNSRFVITVAATDRNGALASFSTPGSSVLVAAPGVGIVTSDRTGIRGYVSGDSATLDGTSFSAPAVSGVVALMLEANPDLGYRDVQEILALSARKVSATASSWTTNASSNWNGGVMHYSEGYGFGLVDARAAVRLAESWVGQQTKANEAVLSASAVLNPVLAIPDNNATGVSTTLRLTGDLTIDRVEVDLNVTHSWVGDLRITLTSPNGTTYSIVDRPGQGRLTSLGSSQDNIGFTFGVAGLLGEQASGDWRLSLSDRFGGFVGNLVSWNLRAYGNTGSADDNHVFTDEFVSLLTADAKRGTITDTDGGYDILNAAAVTSAVRFDLGAGTGSIGDKAISFTAGAFERAVGGDGADVLTASARGSTLLGGRGADTITGGIGGDRLSGGAGDDSLVGGAGIDVVYYDNARSDFRLSRDGDGFLLTGPEGTDHLGQIEVALFNRGALFLNGPGVALFDEATYLVNNPDVAAAVRAGAFASGQAHYNAYGKAEGRSGLDFFDEDYYLTLYPDIAAAVRSGGLSSGFAHWLANGKAEGRSPSLLFDATYYLNKNPDVAAAVRSGAVTAFDHYLGYGMAEGRAATPYFDASAYLTTNTDVKAAGLNALQHFLEFGFAEGRLASVDWAYFG